MDVVLHSGLCDPQAGADLSIARPFCDERRDLLLPAAER